MLLLACAATATAEPATRVFLNGVPTPVYFNDGDSFRVLAGPLRGSRARLAGFNTLESYGPVHQWGTWSREELSRYATLGTLNARKGTWRCTSDMEKDGYGRTLWACPDLVVDQLRKGLAHAMTVTAQGAAADAVAAQAEAIKARRGIWAHGVPKRVMTSLHSASEGYSKGPYNRLIASSDGHSEKWEHTDNYGECQTVCEPASDVDAAKVTAYIAELRAHPTAGPVLAQWEDANVAAALTEFATKGIITANLGGIENRIVLEAEVSRAVASGRLTTSGAPVSCMLYVDFKRRYGPSRAQCLK